MKSTALQVVAFAHIPKTAGTSLISAAAGNYSAEFHFSKGHRGGTLLPDWVAEFSEWASHAAELQRSTAFVHGHFGFGIHEALRHPVTYITFLRSLVDRVVSHYYHLVRPGSGNKWAENPPTLTELLERKQLTIFDNLQTRYLSGVGWQRRNFSGSLANDGPAVGYGDCTEEMLQAAKENLENRFLFGLQDRYADSVTKLGAALGWEQPSQPLQARHVNNDRPALSDVDDKIVAFIEGENALDLELWKFAASLFDLQQTPQS